MKQHEIKEIAARMLTELSGVYRASGNTLQAYSRDINEFINFVAEKKLLYIDEVTDKHIRYFIIKLSELKSQKTTISRKLSSLRKLFEYAVKNKLIDKNPISRIPNPKTVRKLPEIISLDSFLEIFRLIDEENEQSEALRIKSILELLYGSALRVSEICSLNIGDIDIRNSSVKVIGKGSKQRIVPIGTKSLDTIKQYLNINDDQLGNNSLFKDKDGKRVTRFYIYQITKKYLKRVTDINKKSPHILRHSAATHMLDNEADILAVKEILGHENLSTTQIYTHVSIERLKKSYKKAHPKS